MNDTFEIPVSYKGKNLNFKSELLVSGYTYKIQVDVNGYQIVFEPDEERNFRALVDPNVIDTSKIDRGLISAIAEAIESIVK